MENRFIFFFFFDAFTYHYNRPARVVLCIYYLCIIRETAAIRIININSQTRIHSSFLRNTTCIHTQDSHAPKPL
jgi:hypothetical protein